MSVQKQKQKQKSKPKQIRKPEPKFTVPKFSWDSFEDKLSTLRYPEEPPLGSNLSSPPNLGLKNLGNTCFMNAILQFLFHLEPFRNFIISIPEDIASETFSNNLFIGLKRLFLELQDNTSQQTFLIPTTFHYRLSLFGEIDRENRIQKSLQTYEISCAELGEENVPKPNLNFENLTDFKMHDSSEVLNRIIEHLQEVLKLSEEPRIAFYSIISSIREQLFCPKGHSCPNGDRKKLKEPEVTIPIILSFPENPKIEVIRTITTFSLREKLEAAATNEGKFFTKTIRYIFNITSAKRDILNEYYSHVLLLRNLERMDIETIILGSRKAKRNFVTQERRRKILYSFSALSRHSYLPPIMTDVKEKQQEKLDRLEELIRNDQLWYFKIDPLEGSDEVEMASDSFEKTFQTILAGELVSSSGSSGDDFVEFKRPTNPIHINDLIGEYFKSEFLECECDNGCQESISIKKNIFIPSPLLIFSLSRVVMNSNGQNVKIDNSVLVEEILDMFPYVGDGETSRYSLQSVVIHKGGSNGGHYYSYAKKDGEWYEYNDSSVTKVKFSAISGQIAQLGYVYSE